MSDPISAEASAQALAGLEQLRLEKFRALVRHAQAHSPYYARIMRERGLTADGSKPEDFPVLTKSLLMEHFDEIVTDRRITKRRIAEFLACSSSPRDRLFEEYTVTHTSGTSGEVGYFVYAPADYKRLGGLRALHRRIKPRRRFPGRLRIALYSATGGHSAGISALSRVGSGINRFFIKAVPFEVNAPLPDTVARLNRFRPEILFGYTTALRLLAEEQSAGRLRIEPIAVIATGEMVTRADLETLEAAFPATDAISVYACTEHTILGFSDEDGETMTLLDDRFVFECHEDHSLITNLSNYTMPLIRYRTSDILEPLASPAPGRTRVRNVIGRGEDLVPLLDAEGEKRFINPHTLSAFCVAGVRRVQMQVTAPSAFRFLFCLDGGASAEVRRAASEEVDERLRQILAQKGLANVSFETRIVADIAASEGTRKYQFVVDMRERAMTEHPVSPS